MEKKKSIDMIAGKKYPAIRRPNPVIEAQDIEAAPSKENCWTWVGEQHSSPGVEMQPASTGEDIFRSRGCFSVLPCLVGGLVGPCGRPKSEWGLSPYQAGIAYMAGLNSICRSDSRDCIRCPMNPNRVENEE